MQTQEEIGAIVPRDTQDEIAARIFSLTERGENLEIRDIHTAETAGSIIVECDAVLKVIDEKVGPVVRQTDLAHRAAKKLEHALSDPVRAIRGRCADGLAEWHRRQEVERKKVEAELQVLAKRQHEDTAMSAAVAVALTDGQEAGGRILDEFGDAPPVQIEKPKIAGISLGTAWRGEVVNAAAFIKGLHDGSVPLSAFDKDGCSNLVDRQAKAAEGRINYPGVRVWEEGTVRRTGRT